MDIFDRFDIDRDSFNEGVMLGFILYSPFFVLYAAFGIPLLIAALAVLPSFLWKLLGF